METTSIVKTLVIDESRAARSKQFYEYLETHYNLGLAFLKYYRNDLALWKGKSGFFPKKLGSNNPSKLNNITTEMTK